MPSGSELKYSSKAPVSLMTRMHELTPQHQRASYNEPVGLAHQTVCIGSTTAELMRWRPLAATQRPSATQASTPDRSSSSSEMV